jgi:hypothetical protein
LSSAWHYGPFFQIESLSRMRVCGGMRSSGASALLYAGRFITLRSSPARPTHAAEGPVHVHSRTWVFWQGKGVERKSPCAPPARRSGSAAAAKVPLCTHLNLLCARWSGSRGAPLNRRVALKHSISCAPTAMNNAVSSPSTHFGIFHFQQLKFTASV